jgi:hypothetical protein
VPDFNLLTAARSQDRINVVIEFFLFGGDTIGLSVETCYRASKSDAPTRNLATYHQILFVMAFCCDYVYEPDLEPNCHLADFSSLLPPDENCPLCLMKPHR